MGDRYTISERLDRGGMAEVFIGEAESLQGFKKKVAIKRILPSLTENEKFVAMFLDEARLSLHLQHANIVQVFDIGMSDASYFLVMEYVNGCNLKKLLEQLEETGRRIQIPHAIYVILECCKGLSYAHSLENHDSGEPLHIVHRDISPPNILLSRMGEIKLVDFGLAKASSQLESTDPGVVKGKFSYLCPEAAEGRTVDARADIFSVGIILWEMLTGSRLFLGETDYQTIELVRQARIPSMAALNPEVEEELESIVRQALARDPEQRFETAADLGDALAQYLFSRRMKVTARDVAKLVRTVQGKSDLERKKNRQGSFIDVLIQEEMGKLTSILDTRESPLAEGSDGARSLNPLEFVNTADWVSDFGLDSTGDTPVPGVAPPGPRTPAPMAPPKRSDTDIESLSQMLEPEQRGAAASANAGAPARERAQTRPVEAPAPAPSTKSLTTILIAIILILLAAISTGVFVFRDRLF